jgi:hypothetical protein
MVERDHGRKGTPLQSAMNKLTIYMNRAGTELPRHQHGVLEQIKDELRLLVHAHT